MLASWASRRSTPPGWLAVEPEDADPAQFWSRVLLSLQLAPGVPADSTLATMTAPPTFDARFVSHLIRASDELTGVRTLVLDDVHLLTGTMAMETLANAVRRGLGSLRLVISTRSDPIIALQRLRLRNELTEIHSTHLGFDPTEAGVLLALHDVTLRPEQLKTVLVKTEGWAAGLRLAALSLQSSEDMNQAVEALAGEQRTVADYFVEEVLLPQTDELTSFLLDTCLVRRISADLANALTGRDDGQRMLAQLERENLFIVALDDRRVWYRYHHLFADLLRNRLSLEGPARQLALHQRAADWWSRHDEPLEAARHLATAGDWAGLARLVVRDAGRPIMGLERMSLLELLRGIPSDVLDESPELATAAAVACCATYDAPAATAHIARARGALTRAARDEEPLADAILTALEAEAAWVAGDTRQQIRSAVAALAKLDGLGPDEAPLLRTSRASTLLMLAMGRLWTARLADAEACFREASTALASSPQLTHSFAVPLHASLSLLRAFQGRVDEADEESVTALALAEESGSLMLPQSAVAFLARALVYLVRAEPEKCAAALDSGRRCLAGSRDRSVEAGMMLTQAGLDVMSGEVAAARLTLARLPGEVTGWQPGPFLDQWRELVEAEVALATGRVDEVVAGLGASDGQLEEESTAAWRAVLRARALLALNRPGECLTLVSKVTAGASADPVPLIHGWLLTALAHDQLRHDADASTALGIALRLAEPHDIKRPFVVGGDRVHTLLERYRQAHLSPSPFTATLLAKLGPALAPIGPALLEPLTHRERSVLVLLPTMMTNTEIADELFVSVNTVKVHLKALYRKLGVSSRRRAVLRAQELGLMQDLPVA